MFVTHGDKDGFHTKGYIFRKEEIYRIIIGSANMTAGALKVNRGRGTPSWWDWKPEKWWETFFRNSVLFGRIPTALAYEEFIEDYRVRYALVKKQKQVARETVPVSLEQYRLQPNAMQTAFVRNVRKLVRQGARRALLISATGTGKTYASAFALRDMHPKKSAVSGAPGADCPAGTGQLSESLWPPEGRRFALALRLAFRPHVRGIGIHLPGGIL